jgi:protoheme IX farnesyltransferase
MSFLADAFALAKPKITLMALVVTAAAAWLAPADLSPADFALALSGIGLLVAAANSLNQFIERDGDALMERTRSRPLPDQRMQPATCLAVGLTLATLSLVMLALFTNALTFWLSVVALVNYVAIYTPMKRLSTLALPVGAISGAMPVLLGWTAATGSINLMGGLLFAVFFLWQLPHFLVISLFRKGEYERAGIKIVPLERGDVVTKRQTLAYTTALIPLSLALTIWGDAGVAYFATAVAANVAYVGINVYGLSEKAGSAWARKSFLVSLVYPLALLSGLALDVVLA